MAYVKHEFKSGDKLYAHQLNEMDAQIYDNESRSLKSVLFSAQTLTEEQKAQARANIGATAGEDVEIADSVEWLNENGDTSKKYVLPDGYIYAYMEKYVTEKHNANTGLINQRPNTNTSMSGALATQSGILTSDLIPFDSYWRTMAAAERSKSTVTISGIEKLVPAYNSYSIWVFYYKTDGSYSIAAQSKNFSSINVASGTDISLPLSFYLKDANLSPSGGWAGTGYMRIVLGISTASITEADVANLSINVPYYDFEGTKTGWFSTGQQHSNDKATQQNTADISALKERTGLLETDVAELKESSGTIKISTNEVLYAVGDSITKGYGLSDMTDSWASRIVGINGYDATNSKKFGYSGMGFCTTGESKTARIVVDENNFAAADIVTVALGVNDWKNYNATLDDFFAEMVYCFTKIRNDNPYCKIFYILPFNWKPASSSFSTFYALGYIGDSNAARPYGNSMQSFIDMIKAKFEEAALKALNIHVIDMSKSYAITRHNIDTVLSDGLHPNAACHEVLAREIARRIASI